MLNGWGMTVGEVVYGILCSKSCDTPNSDARGPRPPIEMDGLPVTHVVDAVRIDINGDLRVWSLWSQISVTKHIAKFSSKFYPHGSLPLFSFPSSPQPYKHGMSRTMCVMRYHRMRHATRFRTRRGLFACWHAQPSARACFIHAEMHSITASLAQVPKAPPTCFTWG